MHPHPSGMRSPIRSHSVLTWATYVARSRYTVTASSKDDSTGSARTGRNRRGLGQRGFFGHEGTR